MKMAYMSYENEKYFGEVERAENNRVILKGVKANRKDAFLDYLKAKNLGELLTIDTSLDYVIVEDLSRESQIKLDLAVRYFEVARETALAFIVNDRFDKLWSQNEK